MRLPGIRFVITAAAVLAATLVTVDGARAADYPSREIELVVAFPAGGPADTSARVLAPLMSSILKQPIVVINKAGAGGIVGTDYAAKAKPDGYTVYVSTNSVLTINPHLKLMATTAADFTPIGAFAADLGAVIVRSGGPARTLEQFVDYAKKNPGKLNYGSAGYGTVSFFSMELFKLVYGVDLLHVPFKGTGPVKTALMGGHITVGSSGFGAFGPLIRSGDLIALATTSPSRVAAFPDVPTMAEKGFPEASLNIWMGLYVPVNTPKPIVDTLVKALAQAAKDPALAAGLDKAGMYQDYRDPAATLALIEQESAAVGKVVERLKLPKD